MISIFSNIIVLFLPIYIWIISTTEVKKFIIFFLVYEYVNIFGFGISSVEKINLIWITFSIGLLTSQFIFKSLIPQNFFSKKLIFADKIAYKFLSTDIKNKLGQIFFIFIFLLIGLFLSTGITTEYDGILNSYFFKKIFDSATLFFTVSLIYLLDYCIDKKDFSINKLKKIFLLISTTYLASVGATSKSTSFALLQGLFMMITFLIYKFIQVRKKEKFLSKFLLKNLIFYISLSIIGTILLINFLNNLGIGNLLVVLNYRFFIETQVAINNYLSLISSGFDNWKLFSDVPLTLTPLVSPIDNFLNIRTVGSLGIISSCKAVAECIANYKYEVLYPLPFWGYFDFNYFGSFITGFIFNVIYVKLNYLYQTISLISEEKYKFNLNLYKIILLVLILSMIIQLSAGKFLWIFTDNFIGIVIITLLILIPKIKFN